MKTDTIKGPLAETWGILRTEFMDLLKGVLKIELLCLFIVLVSLIAAAAAVIALNGISVIASVLAGAVILIAGLAGAGIVNSVNYNFVESVVNKRKMIFPDTVRGNALPFIKYVLFTMLLSLVIMGPIAAVFIFVILSAYGSDQSGLTVTFVQLIFRLVITIVGAIYGLFAQFAIFEVLLSRRGVIDGFRQSLGIVRKNFYETVIFSVILWAVESAIAIPVIVLLVLLVFGGLLGGVALGSSSFLLWIAIGITALVLIVILSAVNLVVGITTKYRFWMRVKKSF
ncbi:MAG: hypothetical protein U0R44_04240 [Candidatus Micrarchaeia archaeon]